MTTLVTIGLWMVLSLLSVVLFLVLRTQALQRQLRDQTMRADEAERALAAMKRINDKVSKLDEVQREQSIEAGRPEHLAKRADFESEWLPGARGGL